MAFLTAINEGLQNNGWGGMLRGASNTVLPYTTNKAMTNPTTSPVTSTFDYAALGPAINKPTSPSGMPTKVTFDTVMPGAAASPTYLSANGADRFILPQYQSKIDTQGLDKLRGQSLSNSNSPWTSLAMQNRQAQGMEDLQQTQRGTAQQNLALMRQGNPAMGAMNAMKNSGQNYMQNRGEVRADLQNLRLQAQQDQVKNLQTQAGNELNALQPNNFNIQNSMTQKRGEDLARMSAWEEQMKAWAGTQQARATIDAGKK